MDELTEDMKARELADPTWLDDMRAVLRHARQDVSYGVYKRLKELEARPIEEDFIPLQVRAAGWFVYYCIRRGIKGRPRLTVTPTGELDATWEGRAQEKVVMRFFPTGTVWRGTSGWMIPGAASMDKDIKERLRLGTALEKEAADRIEELEADLSEAHRLIREDQARFDGRVKKLEDRLSRAMVFHQQIREVTTNVIETLGTKDKE